MSDAQHPPDRRDVRSVVGSGLARLLLLPITAATGLATARLVIDAVGPGAYGVVALVGTLALLLPFADLGVGAAVTRAVAASVDPQHDDGVAQVVRRARRVLLGSAAVIAACAGAVGAAGRWGPWLGIDHHLRHPNLVVTLTLVLFAVSLQPAVGQRLLLAVGKNHLSVVASVLGPLASLGAVICLRATHVSTPDAYVLIYPFGALVAAVSAGALAARITGIRPSWRGPADARVMPTALPMFIISLGLPLGLQSDRIIISHRLTDHDLGRYALAFSLYYPGWSVLSTAAFALLPIFVRRRARGTPTRRLWLSIVAAFGAVTATCGVLFVVLSPWVARVVSGDRIHLALGLRVSFAALLVVQILGLVNGMVLNDIAGMRFQAGCVTAMMIANLALSWWLAGSLGVSGPVVASAVTVGGLMTLPAWLRGMRETTVALAPAEDLAPEGV